MDSLGSILPKVLHRRGLHKHATAALVTHRATDWLKATLPHCAEQLHVDTLKDGVLTISAVHPIAAQECTPILPSLRVFLERECKGIVVREVRLMRSR